MKSGSIVEVDEKKFARKSSYLDVPGSIEFRSPVFVSDNLQRIKTPEFQPTQAHPKSMQALEKPMSLNNFEPAINI